MKKSHMVKVVESCLQSVFCIFFHLDICLPNNKSYLIFICIFVIKMDLK